MAEKPTAVDGS